MSGTEPRYQGQLGTAEATLRKDVHGVSLSLCRSLALSLSLFARVCLSLSLCLFSRCVYIHFYRQGRSTVLCICYEISGTDRNYAAMRWYWSFLCTSSQPSGRHASLHRGVFSFTIPQMSCGGGSAAIYGSAFCLRWSGQPVPCVRESPDRARTGSASVFGSNAHILAGGLPFLAKLTFIGGGYSPLATSSLLSPKHPPSPPPSPPPRLSPPRRTELVAATLSASARTTESPVLTSGLIPTSLQPSFQKCTAHVPPSPRPKFLEMRAPYVAASMRIPSIAGICEAAQALSLGDRSRRT
eukprot:3879930-Rhodomonas_salina.3